MLSYLHVHTLGCIHSLTYIYMMFVKASKTKRRGLEKVEQFFNVS